MEKISQSLIRIYQKLKPIRGQILKTFTGNDASCRFSPTCSDYALHAIKKHGFLKGTLMGGWRILRCNPFNAGGYDPVI
ncbi:MAG TPA: membrane protein insertion efficiency factor YidD [Patescibacteria group bacterium]|nr:membrane protein insertion efficiency factor YidD [Patescibacteria group bacterium]